MGVPNCWRVKLRRTRIRRPPVDVLPAQGDQLALAHAGHRGGQVKGVLGGAEVVVRDGAEQGVELVEVEVADVGIGGRGAGAIDLIDRVGGNPASPDGVSEEPVEEGEQVGKGLGCETLALLGGDQPPQVLGVDPLQRRSPKKGFRCFRSIER